MNAHDSLVSVVCSPAINCRRDGDDGFASPNAFDFNFDRVGKDVCSISYSTRNYLHCDNPGMIFIVGSTFFPCRHLGLLRALVFDNIALRSSIQTRTRTGK